MSGAPSGSQPSVSANGVDSNISIILTTKGTGGVGIGTSSPANALDVKGAAAFGTYAGTASGASNGIIVSGNVGIGTTSSAATLDVTGNGIHIASGGGAASGVLWNNSGTLTWNSTALTVGGSVTASGATGYVPYFTSTTTLGDSVIFQTGGKVGIGTTSPQNLLDVNGAASIGYNVAAPSNGLIVSGSVGIGVASPAAFLDVEAGTAASYVNGLGIKFVCPEWRQRVLRFFHQWWKYYFDTGSRWSGVRRSGRRDWLGKSTALLDVRAALRFSSAPQPP